VWAFVPVVFLLACVGSCLYTTLRGKFVVWAKLLGQLGLRGDERILDMGCGRGTVLLLAAQHLTIGRAVGVDLWRADQSGNSAQATQRNAIAEGVANCVDLHTGDMTALPLEDNSFDVVVQFGDSQYPRTCWPEEGARRSRGRVLRPGGRLMIADIWATRQYQTHLAKTGMSDVARRGLGSRFWWGGPWAATRLVTATKRLRTGGLCDARGQFSAQLWGG
jgi:SAM-dependent methyltransferase